RAFAVAARMEHVREIEERVATLVRKVASRRELDGGVRLATCLVPYSTRDESERPCASGVGLGRDVAWGRPLQGDRRKPLTFLEALLLDEGAREQRCRRRADSTLAELLVEVERAPEMILGALGRAERGLGKPGPVQRTCERERRRALLEHGNALVRKLSRTLGSASDRLQR